MPRKLFALLLGLVMLAAVGIPAAYAASALNVGHDHAHAALLLREGEEIEPSATQEPAASPEPEPTAAPETTPAPETTLAPETTPAPEPTVQADPTAVPAQNALYERLMACGSAEAMEALLADYTQEALEALVAAFTPEQLAAVQAHYAALAPEAQEPPQTVNFSDAGPLLPAVHVGAAKRANATRDAAILDSLGDNGVVLSKSATPGANGTYTLRLEAYATGETVTQTVTKPVDIVLVLDQSSALTDAMKTAVNTFIDGVAAKYGEGSDHRMAIVTFNNASTIKNNWTFVDSAGQSTLKDTITNLIQASALSRTDLAMSTARDLITGTGYSYSGPNTERQKVVILFTASIPTGTAAEFNTATADAAIAAAKQMKDAGVTVYTIGAFDGANPGQLYGSSNGNIGSSWSGYKLDLIIYNWVWSNATPPATNRFMNYLSSNTPGATALGLKRSYTGIIIYEEKFEINAAFPWTNAGYYLTASNIAALNSIFQSIETQIGGATNTTLTAATTIKDTVTPYFDVPAASGVSYYTAPCTGAGLTFGAQSPVTGVTGSFSGRQLTVSGFDFSANWCGSHNGTYSGQKLIIEFTVSVRGGFLGGNGVRTNEGLTDGIYAPGSSELLAAFEVQAVDVPIPDITVTAVDKNVYLTNTLSDEQLLAGAGAIAGGVNLPLISGTNFLSGEDAWKDDYVTLAAVLNRAAGITSTTPLLEDSAYTLSVSLTPTTGTGVKSATSSPDSKINVFTPELTFKDSDAWYGDAAPTDYAGNLAGTVWKHGSTLSTAVTMTGDKPTLALTCEPGSGIAEGKVATKGDISVAVTVKIGAEDVTGKTTFAHQACDSACGWTGDASSAKAFLLHVQTCSLTITQTGGAPGQTYVFNINKDGGAYMSVALAGGESVTIYELPVGEYTVTPEAGWSWRDGGSTSDSVSLGDTHPGATVTYTVSTVNNAKWLSGYSGVVKNAYVGAIIPTILPTGGKQPDGDPGAEGGEGE